MNHVRSGNGNKQLALNRLEMADVESVRQNQFIQFRSTMSGWHVLSWVLWDVLSTWSSSPVCRLWTKYCVPLSQHLTRRKQFVRAIDLCRRFCGTFSFVLFKLMLSSLKSMSFFHHRNTTNTYNKLVSSAIAVLPFSVLRENKSFQITIEWINCNFVSWFYRDYTKRPM